jgi:hypothetical protein
MEKHYTGVQISFLPEDGIQTDPQPNFGAKGDILIN